MNIKELIRPNILALKPYSSARDEYEGDALVFLDANENPYPTNYNRYPDPHQKELKKKISQLKGLNEKRIFVGNGSDEAIDLLLRAFCEPREDEVLIPQPTYGMYAVSASLNDIKVKTIGLTDDFDIDVERTLSAVNDKTKMIFLCSPNNPSGNLLSYEKIVQLITEFEGIVVVDEAYIDFSDKASLVDLLDVYDNLVVLQTLSKAWGLAGLRVGMCLASEEIIATLNKIKPPYNINSVTQSIALETLNRVEQKNEAVRKIVEQRGIMEILLSGLKIVQYIYPSDANFLLIRVRNAKRVYAALLGKGIVVRDRSSVILCDDCLRITVGTPSENQLLIHELRKL